MIKNLKPKKCSKCGTWWMKKAMVMNKKSGEFFCPKCVAFDALKMAWALQQDVTLLQACVNAKDYKQEDNN